MASALASEGAAAPVRDEPLTKAGRETTVLFADVIGSTALYERAGDRAAAQAIHNCVKALHAATTASGGRVVRNIGDEIMALFPSASGAAEAATRMHVAVGIRLFLGIRMRCEKDAEFHVSSPFLVVCDPRTAAMRSPAIDPTLRKGTFAEIAGGSPWHSTSSSRTA